MAAKDDLGRVGEDVAVEYLTHHGHTVVDRNWRCAEGEVDAVTVHGDTIVIVEVKTRSTMAYGDPLEAVDSRKHARLWRLAALWVMDHHEIGRGKAVRIDVVGLTGDETAGFEIAHLEDLR